MDEVANVTGIQLYPGFCDTFHMFINKDMPTHFVNDKILLQHTKKLVNCKTDGFHCLQLLYLYTT